jgi:hypothetical protein
MSDQEIEAAIIQKNADKSWLDDIRNRGMKGSPIPSRDQNGKGYCWAHSSVSATLLIRAQNNQPYSDLSAFAVACIIKGYRDEGGWGQESLDFIATRGVPSSAYWAQRSMSPQNDKPETWANAKLHRVTEWIQPKTARQFATCLCNNIPVVSDFNWWSHSVCSVRLKAWGPNGSNLTTTIWNSWGDGWSANGMGDLGPGKSLPDDMVAPRVVTAAYAMNMKAARDRAFLALVDENNAKFGPPRDGKGFCWNFPKWRIDDYVARHEPQYAQGHRPSNDRPIMLDTLFAQAP